jgi:hypothetical protein
MLFERVLLLVEQRISADGSYPGFDIRHMEGPLQYSGLVDSIDILYYRDYQPNCDEALVNYCTQNMPQAVLMSLQNLSARGTGPTPGAIQKIVHQMGIPAVMFWFDIHSDAVTEVMERYLPGVSLNIFLDADVSSHRPTPLARTNHAYAGLTFDESLFNRSEGVRDIPVSFSGSLSRNRPQWFDGLRESGIVPYISDISEKWTPYEEYLSLMCRSKIMLNFSLIGGTPFQRTTLNNRGRAIATADYLIKTFARRALLVAKNPKLLKDTATALNNTAKYTGEAIVTKPRHMVRARVWEALWCKTFLLEEENPITALYLKPYSDYVPFSNLKDLVEKIKYYLEHEEERDRIRMQGRATVGKYYNARIYWENLFEAIGIPPGGEKLHHSGEIWNKAYFDSWLQSHNHKESTR